MCRKKDSVIDKIKELAEVHGVEVIFKPNGHIQIKGNLLVNYYPGSKNQSAYVSGTKGSKRNVSPQMAFDMSFAAPEMIVKKGRDKRKSGASRRQREAMIKRGINKCYWCSKPLTLDTSTVEHKIPLARGGLDNANNRTLACYECNQERGSDMPELTNKGEN